MRLLDSVPGKYLLPLAVVFVTVIGLGAAHAGAAPLSRSPRVAHGQGWTGLPAGAAGQVGVRPPPPHTIAQEPADVTTGAAEGGRVEQMARVTLPRSDATSVKLVTGGVGMMLIGAFLLVASTLRRRGPHPDPE